MGKADRERNAVEHTHTHTACRAPVRSGVCGELLSRARFMLVVEGVFLVSLAVPSFTANSVYMFLCFFVLSSAIALLGRIVKPRLIEHRWKRLMGRKVELSRELLNRNESLLFSPLEAFPIFADC